MIQDSRKEYQQVVNRLYADVSIKNNGGAIVISLQINSAAQFSRVMVVLQGVIGGFVDHSPAIFNKIIHVERLDVCGEKHLGNEARDRHDRLAKLSELGIAHVAIPRTYVTRLYV